MPDPLSYKESTRATGKSLIFDISYQNWIPLAYRYPIAIEATKKWPYLKEKIRSN